MKPCVALSAALLALALCGCEGGARGWTARRQVREPWQMGLHAREKRATTR